MVTSIILVVVFIILILLGGYFGGAETAFTAMNKIKIKAMAEDGDRRARTALYISNNFERALTTLLIGNNITHIGAGAVATALVLNLLRDGFLGNISVDRASFLYGTIISTALVFLFSEMIPKSKANDRSETLALRYASSLRLLMKILYPLAVFFGWITRFVSRVFTATPEPTITADELYDIIDTAEEEGVMDGRQSDILKSTLDFSDTYVSDVMTMREDIFCANIALPVPELVETVKHSNHSRIPVYEGSPDNVVGILNIRVFLKEYLKNGQFDVRSTLTEPFYVAPDDKIDQLFSVMSQEKRYIAMVGAPGKLLGLVTIEDFVEEIVGEIWDEDDVVDKNFIKLGGNRFLVSTRLTMGEVLRRLGLRLPDKKLASRAVMSWVLESFGHFPKEDETFIFHNLEVSIEDLEDNVIEPENSRIDKVVFRILPNPAERPNSGKENG